MEQDGVAGLVAGAVIGAVTYRTLFGAPASACPLPAEAPAAHKAIIAGLEITSSNRQMGSGLIPKLVHLGWADRPEMGLVHTIISQWVFNLTGQITFDDLPRLVGDLPIAVVQIADTDYPCNVYVVSMSQYIDINVSFNGMPQLEDGQSVRFVVE